MERTGSVSRLLVATASQSAAAGRTTRTRSTQPTMPLHSTAGRSWPLATSPVRVLAPAGNCSPRRASAALPAREGRRATGVLRALPGSREKTPRRLSVGVIDRAAYTVTPVMSDGTKGPPVDLRGLFDQFLVEFG
jgi:hypothetical protein